MKTKDLIMAWMVGAIIVGVITVGSYALIFWVGAKIVKAVWSGE